MMDLRKTNFVYHPERGYVPYRRRHKQVLIKADGTVLFEASHDEWKRYGDSWEKSWPDCMLTFVWVLEEVKKK